MKSNSTLKVPTNMLTLNNVATKKISWLFSVVLLTTLLFSGVSFGQRNDCDNNIGGQITVGTSCNPTAFNTTNTSTGYWNGAAGCNAAVNDDTWGWFDATTTSTTIVYQPAANRDAILHLFSAGCNANMTAIACSDEIGNGATETITYATTPGTRYRIRVQRYNSNANMNGTICVYNTPPPPSNDECIGAIELFSDTTCNVVTGTTASATETLVGCTGDADDDVWFNFTAVYNTHTITVTEGTLDDAVFEIFTGSCGTLTSALCIDDYYNDESAEISGFTPGDTYYIRVYSFANISGTFDICITNPPANDDCSGAIELFTDATCNSISGSTIGATESLTGCTGTADDDVWYQFTATQTNATITVTPDSGNIVMEVFSGSCGILTSEQCVNFGGVGSAETAAFDDLIVGDTYYIRTYSNGGSYINFNICITTQCKTWDGSANTNWYNGNNWTPAGVPDEHDCVIIPDAATTFNRSPIADYSIFTPPTPPMPASARSLTIQNNGSLEIESDSYIIITDELNNQGTFTIRNNGSLVQLNDVTNTGNVIMERQINGITSLNYVYWSSAVDGFNVSQIAPSGNPNLMFEWTPTVPGNPGEYGQWSNYTGAMTEGKGYIVRGLQGTTSNTAVFNGVPRNGTVTVPISRGNNTGSGAGAGSTNYTAIDDNWNLLGNPYPSAISADAFLTQNAGLLTAESAPIEGTIYLWDSTGLPSGGSGTDPFYGDYLYNYQGSNYISYNITGPNPSGFGGSIAAGQGFFVLMADVGPNTQNVEFNNGMRGTGDLANNDFLRQSQSASTSIERHRIWLDIINSNNKATSLLVGYIEGATNGMDRLYDGVEMNDTGLKFYSFADGINLSISGKALPFDITETIPLGFEVASNGTFTIAINKLDGLFETTNQAIYLEDLLTNTIHDLRANPYVFTTVSGTHNDRFLLRYTNETLGIDNPEFNSGLNIISYNNEIKVTSTNNPINTIEVYDILGRSIANYNDVNMSDFKFNLSNMSNGTFIVKATLYNGQQKVKKIIH